MVGVSEQISSKDSQSLPPATCAANPLPEPIMLLMVIHDGRNGRDVPTLFISGTMGTMGYVNGRQHPSLVGPFGFV